MKTIRINSSGQVEVTGENKYNGASCPREQAKIVVKIQDMNSSCNAELLESQYLTSKAAETHVFGDAVTPFDRTLEIAISLMVDEECAFLDASIPGKYVSQTLTECVVFSCTLCFKIIEVGKAICQFNAEEKLALAVKYKNIGIGLYKEGGVSKKISAFYMFRNAVRWLAMIGLDEMKDMAGEVQAVKTRCYNNLALYHLHQCHYSHAASAATTVLNVDNRNVKSLYRRAVANTELQNYELAMEDIRAALALDPNNGSVRKQQEVIKRKQKAVSEKYAQAMKRYFK